MGDKNNIKAVSLDGSQGEGGGQILRTSLALSMLTGRPLRIENIRARRAKPGLMRQHLVCVQAAAAISGAEVEGAELGSQQLAFTPGPVKAGDYRFAISSAGSCTLVLQTVLPPLLFADAPSRIELSGGTHNPMAPPFHFLERAWLPLLRRMGGEVELSLRRHGFYPAGGGEVTAHVVPQSGGLRPLHLSERGELREAYAESLVAGVPRSVAQRELEVLGRVLSWSGEQLRTPAMRQNEGPGNVLMATLGFEHVTEVFTEFGERGRSAEEVAQRLLAEMRPYRDSTAAVGPHLCDQLALLVALAGEGHYTSSEITEHSRTNFRVIQQFLPVSFRTEALEGAWKVSVAATMPGSG
ncbi:RNA 3'-terminal phosphate cyclase [Aquabacterium sp. A7-Y]|uniref:RNA 3'-terminal phosphate cyclase n=1 Tax=Aquabacterium sp. A7-Y TaxID=1349605 RepID=UPI00223E55E6|nr:RNA 3'-terminal phosphate cyclase [Aquabacterium sp. A7-Y]MCW7538841.1 RNA 3'-terminal phosphate cyclase [Aquabacterium sp. A7-Y]